jgi:ParB family chromosome partitioning protein
MGHARALLGLEGADAIRRAAARVLEEGLSVRATEAMIRELSGARARAARKAEVDSPAVRALAARLQRRLGCRCRVLPRSPLAGKLEIEYTSLDELDGILAKIGV